MRVTVVIPCRRIRHGLCGLPARTGGSAPRSLLRLGVGTARAAAGQAEVPLLVVSGDRDYTPVDYKRAYLAQLRNARLEVIEDSGHATPLDQPQRLNQLLQAFIAEHSSPLSA